MQTDPFLFQWDVVPKMGQPGSEANQSQTQSSQNFYWGASANESQPLRELKPQTTAKHDLLNISRNREVEFYKAIIFFGVLACF